VTAGAPSPRARRLARHRAELELALRDNLTLDQARQRIAEAHLRRTARCGTSADRPEISEPAPRARSWMERYDNY